MEEELTGCKKFTQFLSNYWKTLLVIIVPIIFLPIPVLYHGPQFKCMYVVLCVAVLWVTEAMPLAVTSMIPMVAFPMMSILSTEEVCMQYFKGTVVMFIGGLVLALAIEYCNLHKRIALGTIRLFGCSMRRLHIGLCLACAFMSFWIVNTAATAMFLPVIKAILEELEENNICSLWLDGRKTPTEEEKLKGDDLPVPSKISNCFYISMAYSATIGGIGTLIGTGTNLVFVGQYEQKFPTESIDFVKFTIYSLPLTVIMEVLLILWLEILYMGLFSLKFKFPYQPLCAIYELSLAIIRITVFFFREQRQSVIKCFSEYESGMSIGLRSKQQEVSYWKTMFSFEKWQQTVLQDCLIFQTIYSGGLETLILRPKSEDAKMFNIGKEAEQLAMKIVKQKYKELGRMTVHEYTVLIIFALFVVALITKTPGFMPGWSDMSDKKIGTATCAIFFVIVLFIFPMNYECLRFFKKTDLPLPLKETKSAMSWGVIHAKVPWGFVFLLGGGFALAKGGDKSGMSHMIGEALTVLKSLPHPVILLIMIIVSEGMTNLSSNVAISNIVLPVLQEMSLAIEVHPVYLMFPSCLACSMAFLLPVGTPPNALIKGFALIRTKDMAIAGSGATVMTIIMLWVWAMSFGLVIFPGSNKFPQFAKDIVNANTTKA